MLLNKFVRQGRALLLQVLGKAELVVRLIVVVVFFCLITALALLLLLLIDKEDGWQVGIDVAIKFLSHGADQELLLLLILA